MKNQIDSKPVLLKIECGLKLAHCPFFVPFKKVLFVSLCTWLIAFFALVSLSSCASMQSESCRGFPFDKEFPGTDHRPLYVYYDVSHKLATGHDGLYFKFYDRYIKDRKLPSKVYNDKHLSLSTKEKKYIAARQAKDEAFDKKYAGKIKKKLLAVAERKWIPPRSLKFQTQWKAKRRYPMGFKDENGYMKVKYPYYLVGDELPAGLETPASFFSPVFFSKYVVAKKHKGYLRDYFISARWPKDGIFNEFVTGMANVGSMVNSRFHANFAEYVLTYYFYKEYTNTQQRSLVAEDLATYYSDVVYRASAEYLYKYMHILNGRERCDYANHAANRIYDYIVTAFIDPLEFQRIRDEYREELLDACWTNQIKIRAFRLRHLQTKEEKEEVKKMRKQFHSGAMRCVND